MMNYRFTPDISRDFSGIPDLISGGKSIKFYGSEYLVVENKGQPINVFEIRKEYTCSPFKQAEIFNNLLFVGSEDHFYIYNLDLKENILSIEIGGYFGSFRIYKSRVFVAEAYGVLCIEFDGKITWLNNSLANDGVIFSNLTDNEIKCRCQIDSPDIWEDVILDIKTGKRIQ